MNFRRTQGHNVQAPVRRKKVVRVRPFRLLIAVLAITGAIVPVGIAVIGQTGSLTARDADIETGPSEIVMPSGAVRVVPVPDPSSASAQYGTPLCGDGYDPTCGPFHWNRDPGPNEPLHVAVEGSTTDGSTVSFLVTATDPDQKIDRNCIKVSYGDSKSEPAVCIHYVCLEPFGPWLPPDKESDRLTRVFKHVFLKPGTYEVSFTFRSKSEACDHPYASLGSAKVQVTVG